MSKYFSPLAISSTKSILRAGLFYEKVYGAV